MAPWILIIIMYGGMESGAAVAHVQNFQSATSCEAAAKKISDATPPWRGPYGKYNVLVTVCVAR